MKDYPLKNTCPICKYKFDMATSLPGQKDVGPRPGDFNICFNCSGWLRFNDDMSLRTLIEDDFNDLEMDQFMSMKATSKFIKEKNLCP